MPKVEPASPAGVKTNITPGDHILTLVEVKEVSGENKFAEPVGVKQDGTPQYPIRDQFLWVFQSASVDPQTRELMDYAVYTGRRYGDDRAKLTSLLSMLMPDADDDARGNLDTDTLVGRRFRARMVNMTTTKGKKIVGHLFMEPVPT